MCIFVTAMTYYFACCRDGTFKERQAEGTHKKRAKRQSRRIGGVCVSRMYVTRTSNAVSVKYITTHTNHDLSLQQAKHLPLPKDVKDGITIKLSLGIPTDRILDGIMSYNGCNLTCIYFP